MSELLARAVDQRTNLEKMEEAEYLPESLLIKIYRYYLAEAYIQKNGIKLDGDAQQNSRTREIIKNIEVAADAETYDLADKIIAGAVVQLAEFDADFLVPK